jgi:50S ribosomal subunit-associated GTPase HflX
MDLPGAQENLDALRKRFPGVEVVAISAARSEGLTDLKERLKAWLFAEDPSAVALPDVTNTKVAACE